MDTDFYDRVWAQIERRNPPLTRAERVSMRPPEIKRLAKLCYDEGAKHTREQLKSASCDMPDFLKGLFR